MNLSPLALIFLVALVHGGDSHVNDGKDVVVEKRMEHKKGDHSFNNIAKVLTNMLEDVFKKTYLKDKTNVNSAQNAFIIMNNNHEDVTNQFPNMIKNYFEYKKDELLTTNRDSLSVFGKIQNGPDENALEWGKAVKELREMVFKLIDQVIETTWGYTGENLVKLKEKANSTFNDVKDKITKIVEGRVFVDSYACKKFTEDKNDKNLLQLVNAVEERIVKVFNDLPQRIKKWCLEAAKFYKKN